MATFTPCQIRRWTPKLDAFAVRHPHFPDRGAFIEACRRAANVHRQAALIDCRGGLFPLLPMKALVELDALVQAHPSPIPTRKVLEYLHADWRIDDLVYVLQRVYAYTLPGEPLNTGWERYLSAFGITQRGHCPHVYDMYRAGLPCWLAAGAYNLPEANPHYPYVVNRLRRAYWGN